jgi:hypothetical protein
MDLVIDFQCKDMAHTKGGIFEKLTDRDVPRNYEHCTGPKLA